MQCATACLLHHPVFHTGTSPREPLLLQGPCKPPPERSGTCILVLYSWHKTETPYA